MSRMTSWVHENKDVMMALGSYFSGLIIFATFVRTFSLTRSQKRSDTAIECGRVFTELMTEKQRVKRLRERAAENGQPAVTAADLPAEAKHYFAQFFAFQYSEYQAYRSGHIDPAIFTIWMRSRRHEWSALDERIHGVNYQDGWRFWLEHWHHGAQDEFTQFMDEVHSAPDDQAVETIVRQKGPWLELCRWRVDRARRQVWVRLHAAYHWLFPRQGTQPGA